MKKIINYCLVIIFCFSPIFSVSAEIQSGLRGRILLQVESHGEAWYVSPRNGLRYFLGRPIDALTVMKEQGVGMTNVNLEKFPIYGNPDSTKKSDPVLVKRFLGYILLQVQSHGEAWYVNPVDGLRYSLGRPDDAFDVMRKLGLGITNANLEKIISAVSGYSFRQMEKEMQDLIVLERKKYGLSGLKWNDDLANVAREHSDNLAKEDVALTAGNLTCEYPMIHHEGLDFGIYHSNRLASRGVYYYGKSAENIALIPVVRRTFTYSTKIANEIEPRVDGCQERQIKFNEDLKAKTENDSYTNEQKIGFIKTDIINRKAEMLNEKTINVTNMVWTNQIDAEKETVEGWMNSPGHRANILRADYDEAGIGISYINGYIIATQVFIQRASCGFKNGACCEKEGYYPYCYTPLSCTNSICQ